ncbi:LysR substrate-binding domain-containing protein [Deinococcus ruber]|uniref:LysR family transcriptional regulator n=1 Tax=Deinococcus ruber TaxID=1848197 RepID=A0A918F9W3_9DEIO|nr:LysR substrate-binding domain-containing protein [Deinococcus ruber]GGR23070.1 LysR family transcriptional regulator [Deinococcus ruber]
MEFKQLRLFVAVAEERNFTRAAQRSHLTQPALTQRIHQLEEELGVPLFHRTTRGAELTEAGQSLLEDARHVLSYVEQSLRRARQAGGVDDSVLHVAWEFTEYGSVPPLPQVFRRLNDIHARVVSDTRELPGTAQVQALLRGEIDVGFLCERFLEDTLGWWPLLTDTFQAVLPEQHPLATLPEVPLAALASEPFLLHRADLGGRERGSLIDHCQRAGFTPQVVYQGMQLHPILAMIAAGRGVGLLRSAVLAMHRPVGVIHRPLAGEPLRWTLGLTWRRESPPPIARVMLAAARAVVPQPRPPR